MKTVLFLLITALLSSCSYKVSRIGYQPAKSPYNNCEIAIQKDADITGSMQKVGEIELKDSGFTASCSESVALQLLKKEGCSLGASLINITEERRADIKSTCYRCKAEFYKLPDSTTLETDTFYSTKNVETRTKSDKKKNIGVTILATSLGFIVGFLVMRAIL